MNILFTSDLHLLRATQDRVLPQLGRWIKQYQPDALVLAGDLASAPQAAEALASLRRLYPAGPIAICLGNHDFWLNHTVRNQYRSLREVVERFWAPAAARFEVTLLDLENCRLSEVTIVGTYGHYDLGFRVPDLAYSGVRVAEQDYLNGYPPTGTLLRWRDFSLMPAGLSLQRIANDQVRAIKSRILEAGTSRVIAVLHTVPFEELLGVPGLKDRPSEAIPSQFAFFRAYLGNRAMGETLEVLRDRLVAVVCGHTHRAAGPIQLGGFIGINIGSDYGFLKAALYCSAANTFHRI